MGLTFKWDGDINLSNGTFKVNDVPIGSGGECCYPPLNFEVIK